MAALAVLVVPAALLLLTVLGVLRILAFLGVLIVLVVVHDGHLLWLDTGTVCPDRG